MLAQHVEAQTLHGQDVIGIALGGSGSEQAVGPVALVQQAVEEVGFAVKAQPGVVSHLFDFQGADGKVGFHFVRACFQGEIVEVGILRAPQPGIGRGDGNGAVFQGEFSQAIHRYGAIHGRHSRNGDAVATVFNVQLFNVGFRYAFQPHGLPDAGHRGVPHAAPLLRQNLLAVGLFLIIQVIPAEDLQLVFDLEGIGDIHGEGFVAAVMLAHQPLVHIHHGMLVRSPNVQQHLSPVEALGQGEPAAVSQNCPLCKMLLHTGQTGFRAEGHQNGGELFRIIPGKVPFSIQIQVRIPLHLGAGIYGPGGSSEGFAPDSCQFLQHNLTPLSFSGAAAPQASP